MPSARPTPSAAILAVAVALAGAAPAAAQSQFGDNKLSYEDGIVYDDDLVPGAGLNAPFLPEQRAGGVRSGSGLSAREVLIDEGLPLGAVVDRTAEEARQNRSTGADNR